MNFRGTTLVALLVVISHCTFCQASQEEASVREVINRLFKGMETRDTASMRSTFAKDITMVSIGRDKNNQANMRKEESVLPWLKGVAGEHDTYFEEIWNLKVQIDGDFAQAWCDYAFYLGNNFHHCGVDAFQLFRSKDGWKIFQLADTRRKEDCEVPKEIANKHR